MGQFQLATFAHFNVATNTAGLNPAQGPPVATYQTRVSDYTGLDREAGDAVLAAYAELYGQVQRKLFADVAAG